MVLSMLTCFTSSTGVKLVVKLGAATNSVPNDDMMLHCSALLGWHLKTGLAFLGIEVVDFACRL